MRDNVVKQKSYDFALRVVKLCIWLKEHKHFEMSRQLLKSGTSIGANIEEALAGQSKKDFLSKMSIASKEARETSYWLRLLTDSQILSQQQSQSMITESEELLKLLTSIVKTVSLEIKAKN
jgi:four helix bundle protein